MKWNRGNSRHLIRITDSEYYNISDYQEVVLTYALSQCVLPINHRISTIHFCTCPKLAQYNLNALFVSYKPNHIFIPEIKNPLDDLSNKTRQSLSADSFAFLFDQYRQNIIQIVPYVIHELTHMYQFQKYGRILYSIFNLLGLHDTMFDKIAFANEKRAAIELDLVPTLYGKN